MRNNLIFFVLFLCFGLLHGANEKAEIDSINNLDFNFLIKDLAHSKEVYSNNIEEAKKINYLFGEAKAKSKLALVYFYFKEEESGFKLSAEALNVFKSQKMFTEMAETYADMAFAIKDINKPQAIAYFKKAMTICESRATGIIEAKVLDNYGFLLETEMLDTAIIFYKKALAIKRSFKDSVGIPYSLNKLAVATAKKGNYKQAFSFLDESDVIVIQQDNPLGIADNLAYRADLYYEKSSLDSAEKYYLLSHQKGRETNFKNLVKFCLKRLVEIKQRQGDYKKALSFANSLQSYKDSIITIETNLALVSYQEKYDKLEREAQIANQSLIIEQEKNQKRLIYAVGFALLVLGGIFSYQFVKKKTREKQELLKQQELERVTLSNSHKEDKLRISQELHDNIGAQLTMMISSIDHLAYGDRNMASQLNPISDYGRSTMDDLRSTVWAMKKEQGTVGELFNKIRGFYKKAESHLQIDIDVENGLEEVILKPNAMLHLYRIAQEAMQNTIKYAQARKVLIEARKRGDEWEFKYTDNGKGFKLDSVNQGNGLNHIKERAAQLNAGCQFSTKLGEGFKLIITLK